MSYNIHHGAGNDACEEPDVPEGEVLPTDCALDLERIADVITAQSPDIVALQEVDQFWARSADVDQPAELAAMLGMEGRFGANLKRAPGKSGNHEHYFGTLTLSRYPILSGENTFLPTPKDWEQRGLLEVHVDVPGVGEVTVLNTHLQAGLAHEQEEATRQRAEQAQAIAERVTELDVPVILMGDFNARASEDELAPLFDDALGMQDAWMVAGDATDGGYTYPAHPVEVAGKRIDFVLASTEFSVEASEVVVDDLTRMASDHYPVIADLSIGDITTPDGAPAKAIPLG